jgi:hypothetical protein
LTVQKPDEIVGSSCSSTNVELPRLTHYSLSSHFVMMSSFATALMVLAPLSAAAQNFPVDAPGVNAANANDPFPFVGGWAGLAMNFGGNSEPSYELEISFSDTCTEYNALCATTRYPPDPFVGALSITAPIICQPHLQGNAPTGRCYQFKEDYSPCQGDVDAIPFCIAFVNIAEQVDGTLYWTFMQGGIATAWGYLQPSNLGPTPPPTARPTMTPTPPTASPTGTPTASPTPTPPTHEPTASPTLTPTAYPTYKPTLNPTAYPTYRPSTYPTFYPTYRPSTYPTYKPTSYPTEEDRLAEVTMPCTHDSLPSCIESCSAADAAGVYQECVELCVNACGGAAQQALYKAMNAFNSNNAPDRVLQTVINPTPDTLPKGAVFNFFPPTANDWPVGQGGSLSANTTTYLPVGIEQGNTVNVELPLNGCDAFNFLDFEDPCGDLAFSDGGVTVSLSYNMKIRCFDNVAGPDPSGNCYQFLSADVDALTNNPQNWDENSLRFYTFSAQRGSSNLYWFSWNYGSVVKQDGLMSRA